MTDRKPTLAEIRERAVDARKWMQVNVKASEQSRSDIAALLEMVAERDARIAELEAKLGRISNLAREMLMPEKCDSEYDWGYEGACQVYGTELRRLLGEGG